MGIDVSRGSSDMDTLFFPSTIILLSMNRIRKADHHLNASRVLGEWQTLQTFVIQSPTLGHSHTSTEQLLPHIVIDICKDQNNQIQLLNPAETQAPADLSLPWLLLKPTCGPNLLASEHLPYF